jgi:OOP family OmpA-OmpF porin
VRRELGLVGLGIGVVVLGVFAQGRHAERMQARLGEAAASVVQSSIHGAVSHVSGRDIEISGFADTEAERTLLIINLNEINGRRTVVDALEVLPNASPFTATLEMSDEAGLGAMQGVVPSEAARARLATVLSADAVAGLTLASGAPNRDWASAVETAIGAMRSMEHGSLTVQDGVVSVTGLARTPIEEGLIRQTLEALPAGYLSSLALELIDDGSPADYRLRYSAIAGATLTGKLPVGMEGIEIATELGVTAFVDDSFYALFGAPDVAGPVFDVLGGWMPDIEVLDVVVSAQGNNVMVGFVPGTDLELAGAALSSELSGLTDVTTSIAAPSGAEGETRINAATGAEEILHAGFWLPMVSFTADMRNCGMAVQAALANFSIKFVSGASRLDARAQRGVNAVASVMLPCVSDAGLTAEIGGHTDNTGGAEANLLLSQQRAAALREALIERGVPADALRAEGYGIAQPIGDNATEEGRALNRRSTIIWFE